MRLRHFVTGVSICLMGWLAVSFFHELPARRPAADKPDVALDPAAASELTVSVSP